MSTENLLMIGVGAFLALGGAQRNGYDQALGNKVSAVASALMAAVGVGMVAFAAWPR